MEDVPMFRGRFEHTIDTKGRLSIPSKFREVLSENYDSRLVVTTYDGFLIAYPHEEWAVLEEKIAALPKFKRDTRNFLRFFYSSARKLHAGSLSKPEGLQIRVVAAPPELLAHLRGSNVT